ncbi:IclR family transcriptional regulator [Microbispora sp. RL4-1S]|uniref:Glycerol operon regulatory protein n=1 Tax=Microbispora oryzae TaxID=2806554 RepID=A0A941APQ9_9ACTN|nr:IclR family transcriptional regulator [Microbispora oryzae]MBP2703949.1 IclR family transcriptional regulator [Microbispora oryzae]
MSGNATGRAGEAVRRAAGATQAGPGGEALERTGPVVARALQILGAFTADRRALTLSELSRRAGLPVSTVHRLAAELVAWGALERDQRGCYHVGLRLWEIGSLAPRGQGLREAALPYLEDLSHVTRENVQLAVREGTEAVFLERIAGTVAVPVLTRVGGRFALTSTGVGLVLLAHAPVDVQEIVLATPVRRHTERTMTTLGELRAALADTRARGYAVSDRQISLDTLSVAAPVRDGTGRVVAAVSLVVRYGTAHPRALAPLVRTSARAISRALGHAGQEGSTERRVPAVPAAPPSRPPVG